MLNNNPVESTVECFGKIPAHWREAPLRYYLKYEKGSNAALYTKEFLGDNEGVIPVYSGQTANNGILGYTNRTDYSATKGIIVSTVGAKAMSTKLISGDFCLSQNCALITSRDDYNISFAHYLLLVLFSFEKAKLANVMIPSLRFEDLDSYSLLVPPLSEQSQIAAFLDRKTAQIDTIIEKKQKLLQLLDEKKKAVINEAVTGQKVWNGNAWVEAAEVKDSGEERIGKIPKDWDVSKLKYLVDVNSNVTIPSIDFKISLDNIESGTGKLKSNDSSEFEGMGNYYKPKDVLFNKLRPYLAKVYLADHYGCSVGELLVFTPNEDLNSKFLFYSILSESFINEVDSSTYGAKMPRASWSFIGNLGISFPTLSEQERIVRYLDNRISVFEMLTDKLTEQIAKLQEYRQSLISEAVTGKIDISNFN